MLGDLMGNFEEKQKAMQSKLATVEIEESYNGITIKGNAARQITDIQIDPDLLEDAEQLQDLLVVTMNKLMEKVGAKEAEMSQQMINDMLPPGMSGLFGG